MSALRNHFNDSLQRLYSKQECGILWRRVVSEICGIEASKSYFISDSDIDATHEKQIKEAAARLASGEPVEYVLGFAEFCSKRFMVDKRVLIPRLETQEIVHFMGENHNRQDCLKILDIGTGSGCIAISLSLLFGKSKVTAIDISADALSLARQNATALGADNVEFFQTDFLKEKPDGMFDIIVSNPPYVRPSEKHTMPKRVLDFEPHNALFIPENDPLVFYKAVSEYGVGHLNCNGKIYVEINQWLGTQTASVFKNNGYSTQILKDSFGEERFVIALKN